MDPKMTLPIGLVLAGGVGRRMGRPKGDLPVDGRSLALRAARTLEPVCRGVLISVRPDGDNPAPGYAAVADDPPAGRGPLAGIHAAFQAAAGADLLVLACDYPRVDTGLLRRLTESGSTAEDLILPAEATGRLHPLVGLWRQSAVVALDEALAERRFKVRDLVDRLRVLRLGPADFPDHDLERAMANVNVPADLDALESDGP
jgi:molybdopterin-guanine dinucleotide biosynthesis protein A